MGSKSDVTVVTATSLRDMADSFERFAATYRQMAQLLEDAKIAELKDVRSLITGVEGVMDSGTFCGYVLTAFLQQIGEKGMREIAGAQAEFQIRQKHTKAHRDAVIAALQAKKQAPKGPKPGEHVAPKATKPRQSKGDQ